MRPNEIDFNSRVKSYYDLSNGEILQGIKPLKQYIQAGADKDAITDLGLILRTGEPEKPAFSVERADVSDWSKDDFILYGRWVNNIVAPPQLKGEKQLSEKVLTNANRLGIGPARSAIRGTFGSLGTYYSEIGAKNVQFRGLFDHWSLEDFIGHIKHTGGDKKPSMESIRQASKYNPKNPKPEFIHDRFKNIGGLSKLMELAGYTVVELWERQDYIEWGVRFMEANDGLKPTSRMANYFSSLEKGPSGTSIRKKFEGIKDYQDEVSEEYLERRADTEHMNAQTLDLLERDINRSVVPIELYIGADKKNEECDDSEHLQTKSTVDGSNEKIVSKLCDLYGEKTVICKYAKYKVLEEVIPYAGETARVNLINNQPSGQDFIVTIRKHYNEAPAKIENTAVLLGFFDDIWPMDDHLNNLKLDQGYLQHYQRFEKVNTVKGPRQKPIKQA